jgi:hypothetical protein
MNLSKLIYCATPSRLAVKTGDIMGFVAEQGHAPLHPFQALPYEMFEGNPKIGRSKSMEWCLKLMGICDEVWLFGISEGTLKEIAYAAKIHKPLRIELDKFDPEWRKLYRKLGPKQENPLGRL